MKKLQVPYNLEKHCLDMYANWVDYIQEIYFACSPEIFPSARCWEYQTDYLEQQFKILEFCKLYNIKSAVLLNGTEATLTDDRLKNVKEYLSTLQEYGLNKVVVANPILGGWIKQNIPGLEIKLSILSLQYTLQKIISFYETGYMDEICLPLDWNHNIDDLKELKRYCPNLRISTIINSICRQNCPLYCWHQSLFNSNRRKEDDRNMQDILNTTLSISSKLSTSFKQIPFILPEELDYYDQFFDGYKVEGRTWSTVALEQRLTYMALRVNPTYINTYLNIAWCCNAPDNTKIEDLDKDWLLYRRNCKNTCWRCKYELYCKETPIHSKFNS